MTKKVVGFFACVLMLGASQTGFAIGVDFEDQGIPLGTQVSPYPLSITSGGFRFDYGPDSILNGWGHLHVGSETFWPYNGTTVLSPHYDVSFARIDWNLFSLSSVDLAGFRGGEGTIQVVGTFADFSTISTTFSLDGVVDGIGGLTDFQTFTFGAGWTNLASARIINTGPDALQGLFSVDNIVVVPEPETYTMLLTGLGLLGFLAGLRKHNI